MQLERKRQQGKPRRRWEENIKIGKIGGCALDPFGYMLFHGCALVNAVINLETSHNVKMYLYLSDC
jgi:hypothetical protein